MVGDCVKRPAESLIKGDFNGSDDGATIDSGHRGVDLTQFDVGETRDAGSGCPFPPDVLMTAYQIDHTVASVWRPTRTPPDLRRSAAPEKELMNCYALAFGLLRRSEVIQLARTRRAGTSYPGLLHHGSTNVLYEVANLIT